MQTGADRLLTQELDTLLHQRVGLITNPASTVGTRQLMDLLAEQTELTLAALFGPEHGVRLQAAAGEAVGDGRDPVTRIPVYSLFGKTHKPQPGMLQGLDVLIFDIQDVGARFYTYISTLGYAMQAAAQANIRMLVLDRPNPLGGERIEGPLLQTDQQSFVGLYPLPIVHGLTVGEIARAIQRERWLPGLDSLKLDILPMQGWSRSMLWHDLPTKWIPPSPNLPTADTALVYPGTCLFEGTVVSEGRGTDDPFLFIGAPWVNSRRLLHTMEETALPGVTFHAHQAIPRTIPGKAIHPKFEQTLVHGVHITVTDPAHFSPVTCGIHLLRALLSQAPDPSIFFHGHHFAHLAGTTQLAEALRQGTDPNAILQSWAPALDSFRERREAWLLY